MLCLCSRISKDQSKNFRWRIWPWKAIYWFYDVLWEMISLPQCTDSPHYIQWYTHCVHRWLKLGKTYGLLHGFDTGRNLIHYTIIHLHRKHWVMTLPGPTRYIWVKPEAGKIRIITHTDRPHPQIWHIFNWAFSNKNHSVKFLYWSLSATHVTLKSVAQLLLVRHSTFKCVINFNVWNHLCTGTFSAATGIFLVT